MLHPDLRNKNILITKDDAGLIDFGSMVRLKFPSAKNSKWIENNKNLTGFQKFVFRLFASDTDYGVSNLKAFEYDTLAPYLIMAKPQQAKSLFDLYLPIKSDYYGKRADFFYDKFVDDKSDISKQIFCDEVAHAELLSKLPDDVRDAEIDKLQLSLFVRDLMYILTKGLPVRMNLAEMSDYITDVTKKNDSKLTSAFLNNDKERGLYYDNCGVHIARCAGYANSILKRYQDRIPFVNTNQHMNLLKEKLL